MQLRKLYEVAKEVGRESNNPEGGLAHDTADHEIVEVIVDIANGSPHKLGIELDSLTDSQRETIVAHFLAAAGEGLRDYNR